MEQNFVFETGERVRRDEIVGTVLSTSNYGNTRVVALLMSDGEVRFFEAKTLRREV